MPVRELPAVHAHRAVVGAARERRDCLARIKQSLRIEGPLQRMEELEDLLLEGLA